ncbi:phosphate acyltransferase PlsX [bacterium]|nr:phosphate acyltransferase PlsX [bacterium]
MRIALDAMGGDFGPKHTLEGAIDAAEILKEDTIVLYGNEEKIRKEEKEMYKWRPWKKIPSNIEIEHCEHEVAMSEKPHIAFKEKKDSPIARALKDQKAGKVNGFVSAGNTGAVMLSAAMLLGRIKGITKPAIGAIFPSKNKSGRVLVIDAGANVDVKPKNLLEFAIMGQLYVQFVDRVRKPRVGLMSIGEEKEKGNQLVLNSYELLRDNIDNFIGNVEGRDIIEGVADLIVMDGFVGNIILKLTEGIASTLVNEFKSIVKRSGIAKLGAIFFNNEIKKIKKMYDYAEYGGAPLLGLNGNVIICHGLSNSVAIKNAILFIKRVHEENLIGKIKDRMEKIKKDT